MNLQIKEQLDKICEDYQKEVVRLDSLLNSLDEELFETIRKPLDMGIGYSTLQLIAKRGEFTRSLDAKYWGKILQVDDIRNTLPLSKREEWDTNIHKQTTRAFIPALAKDLVKYNVEHKDEVLQAKVVELFNSMYWREDDDKRKKGFSQPLEFDMGLYSTASMSRLRETLLTISKVMDTKADLRGVPTLIEYHIPSNGEGYLLAGGIASVKKYQKGTAKLELHPMIVRKLNKYLRLKYPDLIEPLDTQDKRLMAVQKRVGFATEVIPTTLNYEEAKELLWFVNNYRAEVTNNTLTVHNYRLTDDLKALLEKLSVKIEATELDGGGRDNTYSATKYYFDGDKRDYLRLSAYFFGALPE